MPTAVTAKTRLTRIKLVDATARAALLHGLREMTVSHIAKSASLSRRTFYQHFRSKEDALQALYERVVHELVDSVRDAIQSQADPTKRLFAGLNAYLDFQQEGGDLITLLQAEAATPGSLLSPLREQTLDRMVELVDTDVREILGTAVDPFVYRTLYLGLEGLVLHVRNSGPFRPPERARVASVIKRMFVQILVGAKDMPPAPE